MLRNLARQLMVMETACGRAMTHELTQRMRTSPVLPHAEMLATYELDANDRMMKRVSSGEIVILPVRGIIEMRASMWSYYFGGTSCDCLGAAFQAAVDDTTVKKIVFDCDSPGGTYPGIPELAMQIFSQRDAKGVNGIQAVSNPQCSSGALWLCAATQKLWVIGSGVAGSIGCYSLHSEASKWYEEQGITNTMIRDPEAKAAWNPWEPLSDEERAHEQERVNEIAAEFVGAIAKFRGVSKSKVESDFGAGREMSAKDCVSSGLCDGVRTLDQLIGRVAGKNGGKKIEDETPERNVFEHPRLKMKRTA